jgi:multidrug resistance efflux pump
MNKCHISISFQTFEEDLANRSAQMESVQQTGKELEAKATPNDAATIRGQLSELSSLWDRVSALSKKKSVRLEGALKEVRTLFLS